MKTYWMRFGSGDPRTFTGMAPTFLIFSTSSATVTPPPGITEFPPSSGLYYFNWGTTTSIAFLADAATTSPGSSGRYVSGAIDPADRADEYASTLIALGTTNVALGTTNIALGTTNVALGTTSVSYGLLNSQIGSSIVALGTSAVALGTTNIALGTSNVALGTSNFALGTTAVAIGTSLSALGLTILAAQNIGISSMGTIGSTIGGASTDPIDLFGYLRRIQENFEGNQTFLKVPGTLTIYNRGSSITLATKTITNSVSSVVKT